MVRSLAIATAIFAGGCAGPGQGDFSAELVGGFHLVRGSDHQIVVMIDGFIEEKRPEIPSKVIECAVYQHLILAKRQGLQRRNLNPQDSYEVPDPAVFDYWILNASARELLGPMSLAEFQSKKTALGVPANFQLREVDSFRVGTNSAVPTPH